MSVKNEIWMDSGAMVSMIPEQEIYLGPLKTIGSATTVGTRVITLADLFTGNFSLVTNLYRGCVLEIYKVSNDAFTDKTSVISNDATTITVANTLATVITSTATDYYGVLRQFGSPVPAPKGGSSGNTYTAQVLNVEFKSDVKANYNDVGIIFGVLDADGGTERDVGIFFTSDGSFADASSLTGQTEYDITVDISNAQLTTAEEFIDAAIAAINLVDTDEGDGDTLSDFTATRSGDSLILTNVYGGAITRTAGTDDGTSGNAIAALGVANTAHIELTVTTAGATSTSNNARLLSDTWLGLVESVTIPSTSIEMRQLNLAASGTRNYVYQFKGAETTDGGSLQLMCNNFSWLYYVLGNQTFTHTNAAALTTGTDPANAFHVSDTYSDATWIYDNTNKNKFYRVEALDICPPVRLGVDDLDNTFKAVSGTATHLIDYTYTESNGEDLPSFALEYTLKKGSSLSTVATDADSESVYTKIYPGCQVDSLTIEATEGQEIKSTVNIKSKTTVVAPTNYDTFNGQTDVKNFVNYGSRKGSDANLDSGLMTPYFFSNGTIEMFGQEYIRIQSCTLTISNQIQDKRYVGRYDKTSKSHIAGQRTYELSLSGYVVDNQIFEELRNESAFALVGNTSSDIILSFYKDNGEQMILRFHDYMVKTGDFPLTNDKGPITVSWTIQPLQLQSATAKSYWVTQG